MKLLMVCLGNICRSPLAEGIMAHKIKQHQLDWSVDSAGTGAWHVGNLPDSRSIEVAQRHGIDITHQRAKQFETKDFDRYDLILVMDSSNYQNINRLARNDADKKKIDLIMNLAIPGRNVNVPDPYYGEFGFEKVFEMLNQATNAVLEQYAQKNLQHN
ncbi:MAG: low molecular weight protein-tyrosine-phosphatase [Saprospiraceae bacterium]